MKRLLTVIAASAAVAIGGYAAVALAATSTSDPHKTVICHVPPGNPENAHTIEVDDHALQAHLGDNPEGLHGGDSRGPCHEPPTTTGEEPPTTTTTPTEPPRTCPDGGPPNAGKDGQVPGSGNTNDDCDRSVPPPPTTTSSTTETGTTPTTTTSSEPPTTTSTSSEPPVTVTDEPEATSGAAPPKKSTKQCPAPAYMLDGQCVRDHEGEPHPVVPGNG